VNLRTKKTFAILNQMIADGVIENYAVGGAVGAMFYVEPFSTKDLDVFVPTQGQLILELPEFEYLKSLGYTRI